MLFYHFLLFTFYLLLVPGCHSHSNRELVERELRHREMELSEARDALDQCRTENQCLQRQLHVTAESGAGKILPEQASQATALKQINLGRMTGGYDVDRCPGDEALQVVLEPQDCDGHTIKSPGNLKIGVLEISREGIKKPLSCWDVTPEQLRRTWKSGLMGSAYYVVLPWTNWPTTEKLRVVAQLTTADGRTFEADKDIKIHVTAEGEHKPPPVNGPLLAPEGESAPKPRPVEGPSLTKRSPSSRPVTHQAARVDSLKPWWQPNPAPAPQVPAVPPTRPLSEAVQLQRPQ